MAGIAGHITGWLQDLLWLVYPELCASCERPLNSGEVCLCMRCRFHLPQTEFHLEKENPVTKHFWGRIPIQSAAACYHFAKGEKVQHLIHKLKYNGRTDIGVFIGEMYGHSLKDSPTYASAQVIIPVPLHPTKIRKRGYNQSEYFAEGLSKSMGIPLEAKAMKRNVATDTQTRKKRYARFENVNRVFEVSNTQVVEEKHVLLVDDVITTGSTLIACAEAILDLPGTKVSIATIAYA